MDTSVGCDASLRHDEIPPGVGGQRERAGEGPTSIGDNSRRARVGIDNAKRVSLANLHRGQRSVDGASQRKCERWSSTTSSHMEGLIAASDHRGSKRLRRAIVGRGNNRLHAGRFLPCYPDAYQRISGRARAGEEEGPDAIARDERQTRDSDSSTPGNGLRKRRSILDIDQTTEARDRIGRERGVERRPSVRRVGKGRDASTPRDD